MLSKKGFSLIEIMVSVALMGALVLGVMKITQMQNKQSKKSDQMLDGFQVFSLVSSSLLNAEACKLTLQGTKISTPTTALASGSIKNSSGQDMIKIGEKNNSIRLDSLNIIASAGGIPASSVGVANLEVNVTRIEAGGADGQKISRKFPLNINVDSSQNATSCFSSLDNAIETSRKLACEDLGGTFNINAFPVCQLNDLTITGTLNSTSVVASAEIKANSFQYTSDRKFKNNIKELGETLNAVMKLRPVHFDWKDKRQMNKNLQDIGFIAQEIEQVFPEVVYNNNDRKTVDYVRLTPYLVKAIQEQQKEIVKLKKQLRFYTGQEE